GFAWWKSRFEQMHYYFDAFRIDHILGFFRIWSIPMHAVEGIMGHFVPAIPLHLNEFNSRGIWFDYNRYTKPFINENVLWEIFGYDQEYVKNNFLNYDGFGNYALKPEFATQRQVEAHISGWDQNDFANKIKQGLFDLISNVILFEAEGSGGQQYHFRFAMNGTASFRNLDGNTQNQLNELYVNYFFRRQDDFWMKEALQKLPALKRVTNMMVCGEDLGLVPACVPDVMRQLGLLSLEIQRMPKDPKKEFFHPDDAPYLSVITPSTHDMSTIRGWWEEDKMRIQKFYNHELGQWGEAPYYCEAWINKAIVVQHLNSPAMWSIFQLQDILGMNENIRRLNPDDERINVPSNPKHFWRYRMHLTLENLLEQKPFNDEFADYVKTSGR
ncbi:MAG: 4-alpha-glucanotransferase, partial [Bacteroidota bacterium]|nr:4-alpha-glucanotransferase [Bacteroidota bacterium]